MEQDKAVSLILALQKVSPDNQNTHTKLIKALELWYGDLHLHDACQLRVR